MSDVPLAREDAHAAGFMAAAEGKATELCPHDDGDPLRMPWLWGWLYGKASGAMLVTVRGPAADDYAELAEEPAP